MKLPCGCERGLFLCPEAERLWSEVIAAWRKYGAYPQKANWDDYLIARKRYDKHFETLKYSKNSQNLEIDT